MSLLEMNDGNMTIIFISNRLYLVRFSRTEEQLAWWNSVQFRKHGVGCKYY